MTAQISCRRSRRPVLSVSAALANHDSDQRGLNLEVAVPLPNPMRSTIMAVGGPNESQRSSRPMAHQWELDEFLFHAVRVWSGLPWSNSPVCRRAGRANIPWAILAVPPPRTLKRSKRIFSMPSVWNTDLHEPKRCPRSPFHGAPTSGNEFFSSCQLRDARFGFSELDEKSRRARGRPLPGASCDFWRTSKESPRGSIALLMILSHLHLECKWAPGHLFSRPFFSRQ